MPNRRIKKNNNTMIIIIVVVVLLLVGVGTFLGLYFGKVIKFKEDVLDKDGNVCPSGELDVGKVCDGKGVLDGKGKYCPSGNLDVGKVCNGKGIMVDDIYCASGKKDKDGKCCPSGNLDVGNVCDGKGVMAEGEYCPSGFVDAKGICDGSSRKDKDGNFCNKSELSHFNQCCTGGVLDECGICSVHQMANIYDSTTTDGKCCYQYLDRNGACCDKDKKIRYPDEEKDLCCDKLLDPGGRCYDPDKGETPGRMIKGKYCANGIEDKNNKCCASGILSREKDCCANKKDGCGNCNDSKIDKQPELLVDVRFLSNEYGKCDDIDSDERDSVGSKFKYIQNLDGKFGNYDYHKKNTGDIRENCGGHDFKLCSLYVPVDEIPNGIQGITDIQLHNKPKCPDGYTNVYDNGGYSYREINKDTGDKDDLYWCKKKGLKNIYTRDRYNNFVRTQSSKFDDLNGYKTYKNLISGIGGNGCGQYKVYFGNIKKNLCDNNN